MHKNLSAVHPGFHRFRESFLSTIKYLVTYESGMMKCLSVKYIKPSSAGSHCHIFPGDCHTGVLQGSRPHTVLYTSRFNYCMEIVKTTTYIPVEQSNPPQPTTQNAKIQRYLMGGGCRIDPQRRASDRSQMKKSNFAGFLGTNSRKNRPISREFLGENFTKKQSVKNTL